MSRPVYDFQARPIERPSLPAPPPAVYGPHDELFDWLQVRRYLFFCVRSVRRRIGLFLLVWLGMVLLTAAALAVMSKTYRVEARLLAQKNPVLAVRADANPWEQPTRAAA